MNITSLTVRDPRRRGEYHDPYVVATVDEAIYEIADPFVNPVLSQYRTVPCGPFYAVEYKTGAGNWSDLGSGNSGDIGEYNKYGLVKEQLAPVHVLDPDEEHDLYMEVPRLRRLLRKHTGKGITSWQLIVDEDAALRGGLSWRVDAVDSLCYGGAVPFADHCTNDAGRTVVYKGTHLPLCVRHLRIHEDALRAARTSHR